MWFTAIRWSPLSINDQDVYSRAIGGKHRSGGILKLDRNHGGVKLHPIWHDIIAPDGYRIWCNAPLVSRDRSVLRAFGSR
jgi:hypothetical protein